MEKKELNEQKLRNVSGGGSLHTVSVEAGAYGSQEKCYVLKEDHINVKELYIVFVDEYHHNGQGFVFDGSAGISCGELAKLPKIENPVFVNEFPLR